MKFTKEEDYAILLINYLKKYPGQFIPLSQFSDKFNLSFLFLKSIATKLKKAGLIIASKGKSGGYQLVKNKILLGEVIKAVTSNKVVPCHSDCPCFSSCQTKSIWKNINASLEKYLFKIQI